MPRRKQQNPIRCDEDGDTEEVAVASCSLTTSNPQIQALTTTNPQIQALTTTNPQIQALTTTNPQIQALTTTNPQIQAVPLSLPRTTTVPKSESVPKRESLSSKPECSSDQQPSALDLRTVKRPSVPDNRKRTAVASSSNNSLSKFSAESLVNKSSKPQKSIKIETEATPPTKKSTKLSNNGTLNTKTPSSSNTNSLGSLDQLFNLVSKVGAGAGHNPQRVPSAICNNPQECSPGPSCSPRPSNSLQAMASQSALIGLTPFKCEPTGMGAAAAGLSMQELWWKYLKKEESAEVKRMNEAKQIFTCLQCHESFQSMEQLVKHMEQTQHFANVPKHYSWSLQYARQKMRQMKMKLKYSERMMYFCFICRNAFNTAVQQHFSDMHNMHNPVENMNFVQVITADKNGTDTLGTIDCTNGTHTHSTNGTTGTIQKHSPSPLSETATSDSGVDLKPVGHPV